MTDAHATRDSSRVALVTCDLFPDLYADDRLLRDALRGRGATVDAIRWDDPAADWTPYDLVVLRSPWDYTPRRDAFVAWAESVPALANPADVVRWNTDKRYLAELAAAGLPVIPTTYVAPGEPWTPPESGEWVVKPTISVNSANTGRYRLPAEADAALAHVARLGAAGRTAMVQPYLTAIDTAGETAMVCTPDASGRLGFSHALRKGAILTGPDRGDPDEAADPPMAFRTPSAAELAVTEAVLAAVPGGAQRLTYARVDLVPGPDGAPRLMELELTEPSLYLGLAPGSADRLADGIMARLSGRRPARAR